MLTQLQVQIFQIVSDKTNVVEIMQRNMYLLISIILKTKDFKKYSSLSSPRVLLTAKYPKEKSINKFYFNEDIKNFGDPRNKHPLEFPKDDERVRWFVKTTGVIVRNVRREFFTALQISMSAFWVMWSYSHILPFRRNLLSPTSEKMFVRNTSTYLQVHMASFVGQRLYNTAHRTEKANISDVTLK